MQQMNLFEIEGFASLIANIAKNGPSIKEEKEDDKDIKIETKEFKPLQYKGKIPEFLYKVSESLNNNLSILRQIMKGVSLKLSRRNIFADNFETDGENEFFWMGDTNYYPDLEHSYSNKFIVPEKSNLSCGWERLAFFTESYSISVNLGYYVEKTLYVIPLTIVYSLVEEKKKPNQRDRYPNMVTCEAKMKIDKVRADKPRLAEKFYQSLIIVPWTYDEHSHKGIEAFTEDFPYIQELYKEHKNEGLSKALIYNFPLIESLHKGGYSVLASSIEEVYLNYTPYTSNTQIECLNRLLNTNKRKIYEAFKCDKAVCKVLKDERNLVRWDMFRKLYKQGKIESDTIQQLYDLNYTEDQLKKLSTVLGATYNGKKVFNIERLVNYLIRLDISEALERDEALQILSDYLSMCNQLQMMPRIDADSLKREHDIAARLVRNTRNERLAKDMEKVCYDLNALNFEDNTYFVRGIRGYDDLIDEAKQQHNCVAGYACAIAKNKSLIFVVRERKHPERSLVTLELSPDHKTIRQKFLAYNKPIYNKELTEFIENWHSIVKNKQESYLNVTGRAVKELHGDNAVTELLYKAHDLYLKTNKLSDSIKYVFSESEAA